MIQRAVQKGAICVLVGMTTIALAAGVNLSGTWVLDRDKSDQPMMGGRGPGGGGPGGGGFGGGQRGPVDITLEVQQTENELKITRKISRGGQERPPVEQRFTLDGQPNTNAAGMGRGEFKSKTKWNKNTLVTEGTQKMETPRGEFEIEIREEYSLSADGKVLTISTTRTTPMGEQTAKQVYNKK